MATSITQLCRSLPATVHVRDPNVRRQFDAIHEVLRGLKIDSTTGMLYSGTATKALSLTSLGGGTPVVSAVDGMEIQARTLKAGSNIGISVQGNAIVVSATTSDPTDLDEKVGVQAGDTPGYLNAKLVSVATATPLLAYTTTQGKVKGLLAGTGLVIEANDSDVQLSIDPEWAAGAVEDDHLVLCDADDEMAGYLSAKAVSLAAAGTALLVPDAASHVIGVKGIADGTAIAFEDSGSDVEIHLAIGELGTESYDRATHTLLAWNGSTQARVQLPDYATLPAGSSGQVLYHNGTAWVASDLATLVKAVLTGIADTCVPTADDEVLTRTGGVLKWGSLSPCT